MFWISPGATDGQRLNFGTGIDFDDETARLTLMHDGRLGVGTRTAGFKLDVQGDMDGNTKAQYGISRVAVQTVSTRSVGCDKAIANIKGVLNQNRGIWFAFFMDTGTNWQSFFNFWNHESESTIWSNFACGKP